jgi:TIR domain
MPDGRYIFVSYARLDKPFVDRLTSDLAKAGVPLWRDVDEIEPGTNWPQQISTAVSRAVGLIYVSSRNSVLSPWIEKELQEMIAKSGQVFPIVLDNEGAENMPSSLKEIQWVDFREDYNASIAKLRESISRLTDLGAPREQATTQSRGYVFLSYTDADNDFVEELRRYLKKRGYAYWDYSESDRDYHGQLFLELENVIQEAAATLSILSPSWKHSEWAVKEYMFSSEVGTPVFLLQAKKIGPTLVIAGVPYIDFVQDRVSGFKKLDRELNRKGL